MELVLEEHPISPFVAEVLRPLVRWWWGHIAWEKLHRLGLAIDE